MNATSKGGFAIQRLLNYAARLRFPKLLALTGILFLADLVVPDAIPFIDEILLGLGRHSAGHAEESACGC